MGSNPWPQPWPDIDTSLTAIVDGLAEANLGGADEGTVTDLGRRLALLDRINATLSGVAAEIETTLIDRMEDDNVEIEGVGWLSRKQKESDQWRYDRSRDDLRRDLTDKIAVAVAMNPETGEVAPHLKRIVTETVNAVYEAVSVGNPKQSIRTRFDLDPADYRVTSKTGYKLSLITPEGVG